MKLTRENIAKDREHNYVFSSSVHKAVARGQAAECLGLPNCFPVPVRWSMCASSGHFQDNCFRDVRIEIDVAISKIPTDKPLIILPHIGWGHSRMRELAPKCYEYLMKELQKLL